MINKYNNNKNTSLHNLNLYENKYDLKILKENIYKLDFFDILKTQTLTPQFLAKYIMNKKYQITPQEEKINIDFVLLTQPHINRLDLVNELINYDSDDDSFEDFYTYFSKNN